MIEKMSLEQFKQIKNQLAQIVKEFQDNYEAHGHDENYDYDKEEQRVVNQYLKIQNRLSQYDLSDIPYSEWSDMAIYLMKVMKQIFLKQMLTLTLNW